MKYLKLFFIFVLPCSSYASEVADVPSQKEETLFVNEKHKYFCGISANLGKLEVRTCSYQKLDDSTTQELGGNVSKVLSHYKDEEFRRQCSSRNKKNWDVGFFDDLEISKYLPNDKECMCILVRRNMKDYLCGNSVFKNDKQSTLNRMRPIAGLLNQQYEIFKLKSHLYTDSKKTCEIKPIRGCNVSINTSKNVTDGYLKSFYSYQDSLVNSIKEKSWVDNTINEIRKNIFDKGSVTAALKDYNINFERLSIMCSDRSIGSNKHLKALFSVKEFFERICLSSDVKTVLETLERSSSGKNELDVPLEEFFEFDSNLSLENDCTQMNKAMKFMCDIEMKKISAFDYHALNPEYLKELGFPMSKSVNEGLRCLGYKRDDLKYHTLNKPHDFALRQFGTEMNASEDVKPFVTLDGDFYIKPEALPRTTDGLNDKSSREPIRPEFVVNPPSKRKDKKSKPDNHIVPMSGDEGNLHKAEITPTVITNAVVTIPENQALNSFGSVRKELELEQSNGTLTDEKKQEYREVEKQYENILGRDLDIFSDDVDEIRNEMVAERGAKEYTRIANEASQLSSEVQSLTKKAMTAGPRERFQIQGRLKRISNKLRSYKKFGYDFRVKVPTIEQILNVGRGDSHEQLSSFSAIENSHNSGASYKPAKDLKVSDYEPDSSGDKFPSFKLPAAGLGPAQDFTKNFTTGPTKLLPEKNYPVGAKKSVTARGAAKSSSAAGVRRGPASRGGSSGGGVSSGGSLGLSSGGASSPSAYSNTRTYQVENKSYEPQVLNNAEKPSTKVVFVEDLKVMRVFKLNDEKVYEIDAEYTEDSFKENYSQFEEEVKLDGEQFFRYRVKDMERMLRENK